jgi:hypothetical protein
MILIDNGSFVLAGITGVLITTTVGVNLGTAPVVYAQQLVIGGGLTGFTHGEADRVLIVQPTRNSNEDVNVLHNSGLASVGNRCLNGFAATTVGAFWGSCLMYVYDSVEGFWKEVG